MVNDKCLLINKNMETTNQNIENTAAEEINARIQDAANLLGEEDTDTIISGINALHRIAMECYKGGEEEQAYVEVINDIICSYTRESTKIITIKKQKERKICSYPAVIMQTIIDVLFKNKENIYRRYWSNLTDVVFICMDFTEAHLTKVAFTEARLKHTKFNFARLTDVRFNRAKLNKVYFMCDTSLRFVRFDNASLMRTDFNNASLIDVSFNEANLRAKFQKAQLRRVAFNNASLLKAKFTGAQLVDVAFNEANLTNIELNGAKLTRVAFNNAILTNTEIVRAILTNVSFCSATLINVRFKFDGFENSKARFSTVNFSNTKLADKSDEKIIENAYELTK